MKKFIKENYKTIIFLILMILIVKVELPYYIEAPGGTINITQRIDNHYDKKKGSLNMLYVTEYRGNIVTVLLSKIIKSWDLYKISDQQISDENATDIYNRNRAMLNNSIANATIVAYREAGKELTIKSKENVVIATTKENGIKIGDIVLSVDNIEVEDINTLKNYLKEKNPGDKIKILIKRNNREKEITITLEEDKIIGVMLITNYKYETKDDIDNIFKAGEGGSSGGLVLTLAIYSQITGTDLLKGRNIAGTGTIDIDGNVGEIDGIKYKIAGAAKKKIDVVLVSPYNYEEAKKEIEEHKYNIKLVKVKTFKEAIDYLTK